MDAAGGITGDIAALPQRDTATLRTVRKAWSKTLRASPAADVIAAAQALEGGAGQGGKWIAYELILFHPGALAEITEAQIAEFASRAQSWYAVDALGTILTGLLWARGRLPDGLIEAWARSEDRWLRRSALVATVEIPTRGAFGGRAMRSGRSPSVKSPRARPRRHRWKKKGALTGPAGTLQAATGRRLRRFVAEMGAVLHPRASGARCGTSSPPASRPPEKPKVNRGFSKIAASSEDAGAPHMSAMPKPRDLAPVRAETVVEDFIRDGAHLFDRPLDQGACAALLARIRATRDFGASLFLTEEAFDADPQYTGVNPRPGRNLLEGLEDRLAFVEQDPGIVAGVTALLGPDYEILNKKVVCGVPAGSVPAWLKQRILGNPVNNLGRNHVRPQYRDVTYFYGIDFHQDLIDYKAREADFLTLYIYLHPVGRADAPLYLLEGSHILGGSVFPHKLTRIGDKDWLYVNAGHGETVARQKVLTGDAGFAAMWHACTLHGTQPDAAEP